MNPVISPGDRVSVDKMVRGYLRGYEKATVLAWMPSGRLKVKLDGSSIVKVVSPDHVKKVADGPNGVK
ncbi:hypothetical protein GO755_40055 [Spirosoma sp. HMF4905]|uniref:50S ribosomal protein L24 n=1 Tax=Spirosoma arboris TaxID=2682092 RepID=A0A7K1SR50_9BACT|nr:hypothetical protein [Spirosoma arboris]MVM36271.1 hypothetical protein [Spirosoma arboris]